MIPSRALQLFTLLIFLIAPALWATELKPAQATPQLKATVTTYVDAFKEGSFALLKKSSTRHYLESIGGNERATHLVQSLKTKYRDAQAKNIRAYVRPDHPKEMFVNFQIIGPTGTLDSSPGTWFLFKKQSDGSWKIDAILNDFDPES